LKETDMFFVTMSSMEGGVGASTEAARRDCVLASLGHTVRPLFKQSFVSGVAEQRGFSHV
jgi:hypothetical protein